MVFPVNKNREKRANVLLNIYTSNSNLNLKRLLQILKEGEKEEEKNNTHKINYMNYMQSNLRLFWKTDSEIYNLNVIL